MPADGAAACENCEAELVGAFCHECGQAARSPSGSLAAFGRDVVADVANLDAKALRTARLLLTRPGELTAEFLRGRRVRYVQPVQVYLAAVALFFVVNAFRPFVTFDLATRRIVSSLNAAAISGTLSAEKAAELARAGVPLAVYRERFENVVTGYQPTFLIGSVLLFALVLALLFRGAPGGYVRHAVFALHWTAFYLLLMIVQALAGHAAGTRGWIGAALALAALGYLLLALRRVYGQPWLATTIKGALLYVVFQALIVVWMLSAIAFAFAMT
ncbi:MAG TPA: DUF3667 domain-containing protein [Longimicrobiaceae bacterium]|nr:DUF3667 domain-containing protein [Longimicrobiaceae bacterium]